MTDLSAAAVDAIRQLVEDIVRGDYTSIAASGRIGRLTADELRRAIAEYGRTLVSLPTGGIDAADVYPSTSNPSEVSVDLPLWTAEEGRSDLTLSLTVVEDQGGPLVSISDLHVL